MMFVIVCLQTNWDFFEHKEIPPNISVYGNFETYMEANLFLRTNLAVKHFEDIKKSFYEMLSKKEREALPYPPHHGESKGGSLVIKYVVPSDDMPNCELRYVVQEVRAVNTK